MKQVDSTGFEIAGWLGGGAGACFFVGPAVGVSHGAIWGVIAGAAAWLVVAAGAFLAYLYACGALDEAARSEREADNMERKAKALRRQAAAQREIDALMDDIERTGERTQKRGQEVSRG